MEKPGRKWMTLPRVKLPRKKSNLSDVGQNDSGRDVQDSISLSPFPRPRLARTSIIRKKPEENEEKRGGNDSGKKKRAVSNVGTKYPKVRLAETRKKTPLSPSGLLPKEPAKGEHGLWGSYETPSDEFPMVQDELVNALDAYQEDLVNDLDIDLLLPNIEPFLSASQVKDIRKALTKEEKASELIAILKCNSHSRALMKAFIGFLAGLHPKLFQNIKERPPTNEEAQSSLSSFIKNKKGGIVEKGHVLDCESDKRINLETEYVQLYLIRSYEGCKDGCDGDGMSEGDEKHRNDQQMVASSDLGEKVSALNVIDRRFIQGRKVILKGRGGIGKTTLLQWLCYEWAKDSVAMTFSILFLLQLRVLVTIDFPVSLLQLMIAYCVFATGKNGPGEILTKWMDNWSHQVLLMLDGIDEIKDLRYKLKYTKKIDDINTEAQPIDIIINLLRGDLLPESKIIVTTRPTLGLHALNGDIAVEVMGLTRDGIREYIEKNVPKDNAVEVGGLLLRNTALMSLCSITYYCMVLCSLLIEDPSLADRDINTYTRLTTCITMKMASRNHTADKSHGEESFHIKPYFPKLAKLAYWAVFLREPADACLTLFDVKDMAYANLTKNDLEQANDDGILHFTETFNDGKCITKKFLFQFTHLTIQELLASAYFLDSDSVTKNERKRVLNWVVRDGYFNMAILFIFGLRFDSTCDCIQKFRLSIRHNKLVSPTSIQRRFKAMFDTSMDAKLLDYLKNMCKSAGIADKQDFKLQVAQLLHESISLEMSEWLAHSNVLVHKDGTLHIKDVALTAVDIMALVYVAKCSRNLKYLHLVNVNMDDASFKKVAELLKEKKSLRVLNLSYNQLSSNICQDLEISLPYGRQLTSLQLNGVGFGDNGVLSVVNGLIASSALKTLSLDSNGITDVGIRYLVNDTVPKLSALSLNDNSITDVGVMNICVSDILTNLKSLFLGYNQISFTGANYLIPQFSGVELNLRGNQIDMSKMTAGIHGKVQLIDLQENVVGAKRVKFIVAEIKRGKTFQTLDLGNMEINDYGLTLLVKALVGNASVKHVHLAKNRLSRKSGKAVKALTFTCPKLVDVDVSQNSLVLDVCDAFEGSELKRDVKHLDLSHIMNKEGLVQLSRIIRNNSALEGLILNHNDIPPEELTYLVKGLKYCKALTKLELNSANLGRKHSESLSNIIKQCSSLISLDLSKNRIDSENMVSVSNALRGNPKLELLNLNHNNIGEEGIGELFDAIQNNGHLRTLHVACNNIGPRGLNAVAEALQNNVVLSNVVLSNVVLSSLDLSHNVADGGALERFSDSLSSATHLRDLALQDMSISSEGAKHLAKALISNTSLKSLDLFQNNIEDDGAVAIAEALGQNNNLETLVLRANEIESDGVTAIAHSLMANSTLLHLDIGINNIGVRGAMEIGLALQKNNTLRELDLFFSEIDQSAIGYITAALKTNSSLTSLALGWNDIRSGGLFDIADALQENNNLCSLDLSENNIGSGGALFLAEKLKMNESLTHLNLDGNHLHAVGVDAIVDAVKARKVYLNLCLQHNGVFGGNSREILYRKKTSPSASKWVSNDWTQLNSSGRSFLESNYYNHKRGSRISAYYKLCSYENVEYYLQKPTMPDEHTYVNTPLYANDGPGTLRPAVYDSNDDCYMYYSSGSAATSSTSSSN